MTLNFIFYLLLLLIFQLVHVNKDEIERDVVVLGTRKFVTCISSSMICPKTTQIYKYIQLIFA